MNLNREHVHLAGWLAISSAIMALPMILLMPLVNVVGGSGFELLLSVIIGIRTAIFLYVYSVWQEILKTRFAFHEADTVITLMLNAVALVGILAIVAFQMADVPKFITVFTLLGTVGLGILSVLLGARLLRLTHPLFSLLKPYAYSVMAAGVLLLSVLCVPISVLVGGAANVILGVILFKLAGETAS